MEKIEDTFKILKLIEIQKEISLIIDEINRNVQRNNYYFNDYEDFLKYGDDDYYNKELLRLSNEYKDLLKEIIKN